jgi:hypothetical protein
VWFEVNQIETLLDHMDWERETREVKCSLTFVKEINSLLPTHGLNSLR